METKGDFFRLESDLIKNIKQPQHTLDRLFFERVVYLCNRFTEMTVIGI